ncbi:MAG: pectin acetylesterase-family hydrolase [Aquabacterium sp.]|nr:pectin acetylesterase-family hydrolase [Aquabacterium sp.]
MSLNTLIKAVGVSLLCSLASHAAYLKWEMVELPASSGASCGNGSPYRFFVNRTPFTSKTVVMYEGGGACWEKSTCENKGGVQLAAVNPDGIPTNYMSDWNRQAHLGLVTPFTSRIDPLTSVQTQSWNIVYLTYCTGDVHVGNKVQVYTDAAGSAAWYHRGAVNAKAVTAWMAANMRKPEQLLLTGFSAGGTGSTGNYAQMRNGLSPKRSALLADSGPLFWAPRGSTPEQSPSLPLQNTIREVWGLDGPGGIVTELIGKYPGAGDANNLGTLTYGLSKIFPNDRIGYGMFQEDATYSAFSYEKFFPEISGAATPEARLAALNVRWRQDINTMVARMPSSANLGYYLPNYREINKSHCLTIVTFGDTGIKERNLAGVGSFVDNLLDYSGKPVIRAQEASRVKAPATSLTDLVAQLIGKAGLF